MPKQLLKPSSYKFVATFFLLLCCAALSMAQLNTTSPWPKLHANLANSGMGGGSGAVAAGEWSFGTSSDNCGPAAIGPDGTIYFGDMVPSASTPGAVNVHPKPGGGGPGHSYFLVALNPATGLIKWYYAVSNLINGAPAIGANGTIYIGDDVPEIQAITDNGTSASEKWSYTVASTQASGPTIGPDGTIYFTTPSGALQALTDNGASASSLWVVTLIHGSTGTPALDSSGNIYAVDTLGFVSSYNTKNIVIGSPTQNWLYVVSGSVDPDVMVDSSGNVYVLKTNHTLYSISASTGNINWTFDVSGGSGSSSAHSMALGSNGAVYVASNTSGGDTLFSVDPTTGGQNWSFSMASSVTAPTVTVAGDGTLYFAADQLYSFTDNGSSYTNNWTYAISLANGLCYPAIGADGSIYMPAGPSKFVAIGQYILGLSLASNSVAGGSQVTGTIQMSPDAVLNSDAVSLSSSSADVQVPNSLTVPSNGTVPFTLNTSNPASSESVTITAHCLGTTKQVSLTVNPGITLTNARMLPATLTGGLPGDCAVFINMAATSGGQVVDISCPSPKLTLPASVTIPSGQTANNFTFSTSPVSTSETDTVTLNIGSDSITVNVTLNPPAIASFKLLPATITGSAYSDAVVFLNVPAPTGGEVVTLGSSSADANLPASITIAAGATANNVSFKTAVVSSSEPITLTATLGSSSMQTTLTLNPFGVTQFKTLPGTVIGGNVTNAAVFLAGVAGTGGNVVTLSSNSADAILPSTVTVPAGATATNFNFSTNGVASSETVTLTATIGATSAQTTLTITPPGVTQLKMLPPSVLGGTTAQGAVFLTGKGGPSGTTVTLSSSSADAAVPASVVVPSGATAQNFSFTTGPVSSSESITITATIGSSSQQATLTLTPAVVSSIKTLPSTLQGGKPTDFVIFLTGKAGPQGIVVALSSGSSQVVVPASVTIQSGASAASFNIGTLTVTSQTQVTITATTGSTSVQTTVTLTP